MKFNDLFDNFFFYGHKNIQVGSGSSLNQLAFWIRIHNSGLQIRGSGSKRNVYGSTTLIENMYFEKRIQTLPAVLNGPLDVKLTRQHMEETWLLQNTEQSHCQIADEM